MVKQAVCSAFNVSHSKNHSCQTAIANRQGFVPSSCGFVIPQYCLLIALALTFIYSNKNNQNPLGCFHSYKIFQEFI